MDNKVTLVTLGCSWVYGVGSAYDPTRSSLDTREYHKIAWDDSLNDIHSFRGILSRKYNLNNINFSFGGSSNQRQFRVAKEFFMSDEFAEIKDTKIIVLWGITSTARNEFYSLDEKDYLNFIYHQPAKFYEKKWNRPWPFPKLMLQYSYDHDVVVKELSLEMKFWDEFFTNRGITNYWFDTINPHDYSYSERMLFRDQYTHGDLLSILASNAGLQEKDDVYHISTWVSDTNRIPVLNELGLLNPISHHPTKTGHEKLAELFYSVIEDSL